MADCCENISLTFNESLLLDGDWMRETMMLAKPNFTDYPCKFLGILDEVHRKSVMPSLYVYLYSSIFFVFAGLIGNTLSLMVFSAPEMRGASGNVYLLLLSLSDSAYLISVFLSRVLTTIRCLYFPESHLDIVNRHEFMCRFLQHSMDLFSDYSTCLILAFTIERYIAIYAPIRYKSLCTVSRARIVCAGTFAIMFITIAPYHYMFMGQHRGLPVCTVLTDHETTFAILYFIEAMVFRIIPVILIAVLNTLIIVRVSSLRKRKRQRNSGYVLQQNNNQKQQQQRRRTARKADKSMQLTIMLILVSTSYVILFIPVLVQFIMWKLARFEIFTMSRLFMLIWQNYTRALYISGFSINFLLYTLSGRIFREQLCKIICVGRSRTDQRCTTASVEATRSSYL